MFTWVGSQFDVALTNYVLNVVTTLMGALMPVALSAMTLWVCLYGWAIARNEVSETVPTFVWKAFKIGLVFSVALQSSFYISTVSDTANGLATGVASTFLPSTAAANTVTTPYGILDTFNDKASQLVVDLMKEASVWRLDLLLAAVVTSFGNVVFLCITLYTVTLAKVFLTFVIAVGPLFVLCLAWRPTARFFDSWLSMLLNAVVVTWFSFFALGLSAFMGDHLVDAIQGQGGFAGPTFNAVAESLKYCIVMILMAIICFQAPSLASALTGGAAVQQGIQMIQNIRMASGPRFSSRGGAGAASGVGGGEVRAGVGVPYAAGQAVGTAAGMAGRAARQGAGAVRTAAYKLAAMRGRA
ncbi:MAG: type IV secretion system protein [Burkholderiales bacterium]|jgi:type IV secretion system protein VirB6|nr:type IV secretion system protein [Burkholderiales bacterium]